MLPRLNKAGRLSYNKIVSGGRLAQWLEHLLHTQGVRGSNPLLPTIILIQKQGLC